MALEVRVLKCRSIAVEKMGESKNKSLLFSFILSLNPCGIVGSMGNLCHGRCQKCPPSLGAILKIFPWISSF